MRFALLISAVTLLFATCIKPQEYPPEPVIEFISVSSQEITPGEDSLVIEFSFQDGDGDIGANDGDSTINAFLVDQRTGFPYNYQIPFVPAQGNNKAITGTIWVTIDAFSINCRPNRPDFDTISYEVYILDRKNNESNHIQTPKIILDCP